MALNSDQLEAFHTVARLLNVTRAADSLHVTQSALSQRIMKLESEIETSLFVRDRAGIRLTEAGQDLVRYCRCKDSLEEEFLSRLRGGEELAGTIRIGGFSSIMPSVILPALAPLLSENPKVKLEMTIDEIENLPVRLQSGEIDFMVLVERERREGLERVLLGKEVNVLTHKKKYSGAEIYLDHDERDQTTFEFLRLNGRRGKSIERRYLDNVQGIIAGVRLGIGIAVLPRHLIADEKEIEIARTEKALEVPVCLYYYTQPYYSRLHSSVVNVIMKNAAKFF